MIRMLGHVFMTWAVAHALHIIVWMVTLTLSSGHEFDGYMLIIFPICIMGLIYSVPSVFVLWGIAQLTINSSISPMSKLIGWIFCAPVIIGINAFLLMLTVTNGELDKEISREFLLFGAPPVLATFLAVAIRSQQFLKLNAEIASRKTEAEEQTNEPVSQS